MTEPTDLISLLEQRTGADPDRIAYRYLGATRGPRTLTRAELLRAATGIARHLQQQGSLPGERALLLFPPGLEFISAFLGCTASAAIAVPAPPPNPLKPTRSLQRLQSILRSAAPTWALTTSGVLEALRPALDALPAYRSLRWICVDQLPTSEQPLSSRAGPDQAALIQFTSGSTSDPRGVTLSHGNLLENLRYFDQGWDHDERSILVSWLPAFHDLGLVYGVLAPLWGGFDGIQMSPIDVIQRPRLWLEAISTWRATHSGGPNFIYDLCVRKIPAQDVPTLDLRSWRMALTAAEPVRAETLTRFSAHFAPAGFRPRTFCPGYGLSEGTCKVTAVACTAEPTLLSVRASALERHRVEPTDDGPDARTLVGCGRPGLGTQVVIVDPRTRRRLEPGHVGEIWVSGPGVSQRYWGRPRITKDRLAARLPDTSGAFLRTGDLGFLSDGELFITGRIKDVVIVRGANHYPQDIEHTVTDAHPAIRPGCVAAFGREVHGEERLTVVAELDVRRLGDAHPDQIADTVTRAVSEHHGLRLHELVFVRAGTIPKTTSGKIQRHACRAELEAGDLALLEPSAEDAPPDPAPNRDDIRTQLIDIVVDVADLPRERLEPHTSLHALGVDSLAGVNIAYEIGVLTGRDVPDRLISEHDTIGKLVDYVITTGGLQ